jgi:hypothetical protein
LWVGFNRDKATPLGCHPESAAADEGSAVARTRRKTVLRRWATFSRIAFVNTDLAGAADHRYSILEAYRAVAQLLDQVLTA